MSAGKLAVLAPVTPPVPAAAVVVAPVAKASSNTNDAVSVADLVFKFQSRHYSSFGDRIGDGFFDGGRAGGQGTIETVDARLNDVKVAREIIVVDEESDPDLAGCVKRAAAALVNAIDGKAQVAALAKFVAAEFQHPKATAAAANVAIRALLPKGSRRLPLGKLLGKPGVGRHRALLFKFLTDRLSVGGASSGGSGGSSAAAALISGASVIAPDGPGQFLTLDFEARLVRGADLTNPAAGAAAAVGGNGGPAGLPRAWNVVRFVWGRKGGILQQLPEYVVDLMAADPAALIPMDKAQNYARQNPNGTYGGQEIPKAETVWIPYAELKEYKALPSAMQGNMSESGLAVFRRKRVFVKRPSENGSAFEQHQFRLEMEVLSHFQHANVVRLVAACDEPACMVLEFVDGGTLQDVLMSPQTTLLTRVRLIREMCCGLEAMHTFTTPIVHRDMKPKNVLVSTTGDVKICDFGLARFASGLGTLPVAGTDHPDAGTPLYMSPEQLNGLDITPACDVYSVAGMLYLAATGSRPWPELKEFNALYDQLIKGGAPPLPDSVAQKLPADYVQLMHDCYEVEPKRRPKAAAVVARLTTILATLFGNAATGGGSSGSAAADSKSAAADSAPTDLKKSNK